MAIGLMTCAIVFGAAGLGLWIGSRARPAKGLPPVPRARIIMIMVFLVVLLVLFDPFRVFENPPLFHLIFVLLKISGALRDMLPF